MQVSLQWVWSTSPWRPSWVCTTTNTNRLLLWASCLHSGVWVQMPFAFYIRKYLWRKKWTTSYLANDQPFYQVGCKSVEYFLWYSVHRWTNKHPDENITSLAQVIITVAKKSWKWEKQQEMSLFTPEICSQITFVFGCKVIPMGRIFTCIRQIALNGQ